MERLPVSSTEMVLDSWLQLLCFGSSTRICADLIRVLCLEFRCRISNLYGDVFYSLLARGNTKRTFCFFLRPSMCLSTLFCLSARNFHPVRVGIVKYSLLASPGLPALALYTCCIQFSGNIRIS